MQKKTEHALNKFSFWFLGVYLKLVHNSSIPSNNNFLFSFFSFFKAAPVAYGSFLVGGQIGAAAARLGHSHSNAGSKLHLWRTSLVCNLHHSSHQQGQILNLLSEARD